MDTRRWQIIEAAFHELAERPAGPEREAALVACCEGDGALADEIRVLLANDAVLSATTDAADVHVGLRLGHYEVGRLIARGGMAAVYEARRADQQFEQRVAIKIMDLRLSDPALVASFRAERQILAGLEHPAVTRLLDGGVTGLGEPYLVMEFVDGAPIDRYSDSRRLAVADRLRLFAEVCQGVAFAHRNLVLHRDLKPSNILVTSDGRVKVVDFGTATLLEPDRLATTSRAPLTPAYASPEQLTGGAVGTASDQYSLGLVLFELLTGAPAFGDRTSLMAAVERALTGTAATAPHAVVTAAAAAARQTSLARLKRVLAGDLATILGKALAHDAAARYASVQHFADDLVRWQQGAPILARPPSIGYQATRFVQRHRVAVTLATTLAVALVAATGASIRQAALAREQAALARTQAALARTETDKATQLNTFLAGMLSSANPTFTNANAARAGSITVREVLDGASQVVARDLGRTPSVEAEMRRTIGMTYVGIGALDAGTPHLERALALYQAQGDELGIARTRASLANALSRRGRFVEAEVLLRQALAYVNRPGSGAEPAFQLAARSELATVLANQQPAHPEALTLLQEAIALGQRYQIPSAGPSVALHNLGLQLLLAGRIADSETRLREALRGMETLPNVPPERFMVLRSLSEVMRSKQDYPEAVRYATAAVEGMTRELPATHPYQVPARVSLGRALVAVGEVARGRQVLLDAYAAFRAVRTPGHVDLLGPMIGLGVAHRMAGDLAASERILREARAIILANPGVANSMPGIAGELGLTLRAAGRRSEAEALLRDAHTHLQRIYGDDHPSTRRALERVQGATQ